MNLLLIEPLIPPSPNRSASSLSVPQGPRFPCVYIPFPGLCRPALGLKPRGGHVLRLSPLSPKGDFAPAGVLAQGRERNADFAWFEGKIIINQLMSP